MGAVYFTTTMPFLDPSCCHIAGYFSESYMICRYLEGGAVAFYPQLATLTTYQLFVEVL